MGFDLCYASLRKVIVPIFRPRYSAPEAGKGVIDTIIVVLVVSVLTGVVLFYLQNLLRESREAALKAELTNIRHALLYFEIINQRRPQDLQELVRKKFIEPARQDTFFERHYLEPNAVDNEGRILDPFGGVYRYDSNTGHVTSETRGYQDW